MQPPKTPEREGQRLQTLRALGILDTPAEERFDRITRLAQRLLDMPIALVSLVDHDRQWFKSRQGLDATETPRDVSFCGHAILGETIFSISDATLDPRFADNPLVLGAPHVRFYAGAPLFAGEGMSVGTLCVIDSKPRQLSEDQATLLRDLAHWINDLLAQNQRQEAARRLIDREHFLSAVLDTVLEGIVTIDELGSITSFNHAAEVIFGYAAEEVIGANVRILMPEPHRSAHDGYLKRFRDTDEARIIGIGRELQGLRKSGERFAMKLAVAEMARSDPRYFVGVIKDVSQHRLIERRLDESDRWRQAILDAASAAIISTDTDGLIQTFNRAAQDMLGYAEHEMVGRCTPGVFHDAGEVAARARQLSAELGYDIAPGFEVFVVRARQGSTDVREWTYVRKDGSRLPVLLSITALIDGDGAVRGYLGLANDISDRKKMEQLKSEFVATVSHELRTPLTSIRGALSLVLGKTDIVLPDKARRLLENANRNSERLTLLINDILDLEKLESGHMAFAMANLDLIELCASALTANEGYAQQHGIRLEPLVASVSSAETWGDSYRLMQVLSNLLSNAVKYSPPQSSVKLSVLSGRPGYWRVSVHDRGSGIPEPFRDTIFQRFAQADNSDTRAKGGTGLGLSISKAIVERHFGSIDYHSVVGGGTEFFFEIPMSKKVAAFAEPRGAPRILICEDNADVAMVLAELVREHGIECDTVGSAAALRAQLARRSYFALLLDLKLPDANGLSLIREIRHSPEFGTLPIVVVSGRADEGRESFSGEMLSVVDWLQKPVDRGRLERALDRLMSEVARPRIMQVDEDFDFVQVTQSLLEGVADFEHAKSLAEARAKLAEARYDLLIIDVRISQGTGLALLGELPAECKVMIYTDQEIDEALAAQVTAVLTKGKTSQNGLSATIKHLLSLQGTSLHD